jgi:hypothetical protein
MYRTAGIGERRTKLEALVIGDEGACNDNRAISSAALHHHAGARAHDAVR